jgi:hypothetical protein
MGRHATPDEADRDTFAQLPTPWRAPEETEPLQPTNGWAQSAPAGIQMASSLDLNDWVAVAPTRGVNFWPAFPSEAELREDSETDARSLTPEGLSKPQQSVNLSFGRGRLLVKMDLQQRACPACSRIA